MRLRLLVVFLFVLFAQNGYVQHIFDEDIKPAAALPGQYVPLLAGKRVALVINQTSMAGDSSLLDMVLARKVRVVKIFVPEHGFRGKEDAGAHVGNSTDRATGLPVISLYGSHKKPTPADLQDVDVVVYDLQDVGARFYTYISTLQYCMEACAGEHKQFMVLDRPDPNGFYVDGPVLEKENKSFVGMQCIPVVYGMTSGEYARMLVGEQLFPGAATLVFNVIKCAHYTHSKRYRLPVAPSPNLKTMAAVYAYPSLCLFEGTVVSVGRGTDKPFQQFGCPAFAGAFTYSFTPVSGHGAKKPPFENVPCYGELVAATDGEALHKVNSAFHLHWLLQAYNAYPRKDSFFNNFFVKLCGTASLEAAIKNGGTEAAIRATWQPGIAAFKKIRKKYLLYPDFE